MGQRPPPHTRTGLGITLALLAFALFSTMDMLVKRLSGRLPLVQIIFFLGVFGLAPLLALLARDGGPGSLRTRRLGLHAVRGVLGLLGGLSGFFAYSRMPLADAYAIAFSAPLFITALSVPLLGEHVGWRRWTAVGVGFAGVLVMLRPGVKAVDAGSLGALGGAVCYAFSVLLLRRMTRTETLAAQMFYPTLVNIVGAGLVLPLVFVRPSLLELVLLMVAGICGGLAQFCLIRAFEAATAAVVAPFQYSQMLWGTFYGWLLWSVRPDAWTLSGAAVVIGSGLYILHRETRRAPVMTTAAKGASAVGAPVLPEDGRSP